MNWHKLSITEIFESLHTSQHGLSAVEADQNLLETGPNELQEGKKKLYKAWCCN